MHEVYHRTPVGVALLVADATAALPVMQVAFGESSGC